MSGEGQVKTENEETNQVETWEKSVEDGGIGKCQDPETGLCLPCFKEHLNWSCKFWSASFALLSHVCTVIIIIPMIDEETKA